MIMQIRTTAISIALSLLLVSCGGGGGGGGGGTNTATVNPAPNNGDNGNGDNSGDNGNGDNSGDNGNGGNETPNGGNDNPAYEIRDFAMLNQITSGTDSGRGIWAFKVYEITTQTTQNNILFLSHPIQGFEGGHVDDSDVNHDMNSGMARVGDNNFTVLDAYTDNNGYGLLLSDANNELVVIVGSDPYVSLPSGLIEYEGINVSSFKDPDSGEVTTFTGTFQLEVDFASGQGAIQASAKDTEGNTVRNRSFSGPIMVNSTNGTFSGTEEFTHMLLTTGDGSDSAVSLDPVTIEGIFNGDQGSGVAGVYYTKDSGGESSHSGYILGAKTDRPMPVQYTLRRVVIPARTTIATDGFARYSGHSRSNTYQVGRSFLYLGRDIAQFSGGDVDYSGASISPDSISGTISVGTTEFELLDAIIKGENFALLAKRGTYLPTAVVGGEPFFPFTTLPTGTVRYSGDNHAIYSTTRTFGENYLLTTSTNGTFTMNVDFAQGTGTIQANNTNTPYEYDISGNITIDAQYGTFEGNSLMVMENVGGQPFDMKPVILHGNFNGVDAAGVSGIYQFDAATSVTGVILGTKQ